eukprot:Selendium_serpulae@DN2028_c0_g1_i2.p1
MSKNAGTIRAAESDSGGDEDIKVPVKQPIAAAVAAAAVTSNSAKKLAKEPSPIETKPAKNTPAAAITQPKEPEKLERPIEKIIPQKLSAPELSFKCKCDETSFGDVICVTGSHEVLGNWENPIPLEGDQFPLWKSNSLNFSGTDPFEYKYVIKTGNGEKRWEILEGNRSGKPGDSQIDEPHF